MASINFIFLLLPLFLRFHLGESCLELNYYNESCPRAEEIIKEQVSHLYQREENTAISFLRFIFHDCAVESCDASLLLETKDGITSEKTANNSFGLRYSKYINTIKTALETECPNTVSCADILVLSAREAVSVLGGPNIEMKTGRRDSTRSYASIVDEVMPNQDSNMSFALSTFDSIGIDTEGFVALLGYVKWSQNVRDTPPPPTKSPTVFKKKLPIKQKWSTSTDQITNRFQEKITDQTEMVGMSEIKFTNHILMFGNSTVHIPIENTDHLPGSHTVGRAHCRSFVKRLYPTIDPTLAPSYADYLTTRRCPIEASSRFDVKYAKNDPKTPMLFDNMYYKNLLDDMGLLRIDQELVSDNRTNPFVVRMAGDNEYFFEQFSRAMQILSENNPLTGVEGEIRKDCRFVNSNNTQDGAFRLV